MCFYHHSEQGLLAAFSQTNKVGLLTDCGTSQPFVSCVHGFVIAYLPSSFVKGSAIAELLAENQMARKAASLAQVQVPQVAPARPSQRQALRVAVAYLTSGACQHPR